MCFAHIPEPFVFPYETRMIELFMESEAKPGASSGR